MQISWIFKSADKWTHTVQTYVFQESTVMISALLDTRPIKLQGWPNVVALCPGGEKSMMCFRLSH